MYYARVMYVGEGIKIYCLPLSLSMCHVRMFIVYLSTYELCAFYWPCCQLLCVLIDTHLLYVMMHYLDGYNYLVGYRSRSIIESEESPTSDPQHTTFDTFYPLTRIPMYVSLCFYFTHHWGSSQVLHSKHAEAGE